MKGATASVVLCSLLAFAATRVWAQSDGASGASASASAPGSAAGASAPASAAGAPDGSADTSGPSAEDVSSTQGRDTNPRYSTDAGRVEDGGAWAHHAMEPSVVSSSYEAQDAEDPYAIDPYERDPYEEAGDDATRARAESDDAPTGPLAASTPGFAPVPSVPSRASDAEGESADAVAPPAEDALLPPGREPNGRDLSGRVEDAGADDLLAPTAHPAHQAQLAEDPYPVDPYATDPYDEADR